MRSKWMSERFSKFVHYLCYGMFSMPFNPLPTFLYKDTIYVLDSVGSSFVYHIAVFYQSSIPTLIVYCLFCLPFYHF